MKKVKTYDCSKRISPQARRALQQAIDTHQKYSKSYFWSSGGSASQRRANEERFPGVNMDFMTSSGLLEVRQDYSESCRNCCYSASYYLDGSKKDIRAVKKLIKTTKAKSNV